MTVRKLPQDWDLCQSVLTAFPDLPDSRRLLLWGPPGTGKTTAATTYGRERDECIVIECFDEMSPADVLGHWMPVGDRFVFNTGRLPLAMLLGKRLVLDEFDKAPGAVMDLIRQVTARDDVASLTIPDPELFGSALDAGEIAASIASGDGLKVIRPAEGYEVVACQNGDFRDLEFPIQDRFPTRIEITNVHPAALEALPDDLRDAARKTAAEPDDERRVGIRAWRTFADLRVLIGEDKAMRAVFGVRSGDVEDALKLSRKSAPKLPDPVLPDKPPVDRDGTYGPLPTTYLLNERRAGKPRRVSCPNHNGPGEHLKRHEADIHDDGLYCNRCDVKCAEASDFYVRVKPPGEDKWSCPECGSHTCRESHLTPGEESF